MVIRLWRFRRTAVLCEVRSCSSPSRWDRTHSQVSLQDRYYHHTGLLSRGLCSRWLSIRWYQVVIRLWRFLGGRGYGNSDWLQYCAGLGHVDSSPLTWNAHTYRLLSRIGSATILGYSLGGSSFSRSLLYIYIHIMHGLACGFDWFNVCMYVCMYARMSITIK